MIIRMFFISFFLAALMIPISSTDCETGEFWDTIFEVHGTPMLLIEVDSGRIVNANKAASRFYGYPEDILETMVIQDINMLTAQEVEIERRAAASEQRNFFVFQHQLRSGEIRTVEVTSTPVGENLLYSVIHDITPKVEAEQQLKDYIFKLEQSEQLSLTGFWEYHLQERKLIVSEGFEHIIGSEAAEISIESFKELMTAESRLEFGVSFQKLIDVFQPFRVELQINRPADGRMIDALTIATIDESRGIIFGSIKDVTEHNQIVQTAISRRNNITALLAALLITGLAAGFFLLHMLRQRNRALVNVKHAHRLLETVLDTIPVEVFWKDRNSIYLGCNRHFAQEAGLSSPDEIVGKTDYQLHWNRFADSWRDDEQRIIERGESQINQILEMTGVEGEEKTFIVNQIPLRNDENEITGVLGTCENITEQRRMQVSLHTSEERYRELFLANPHPMWVYDLDSLRFLEVNDTAIEAYGYSRKEFLEMTELNVLADEQDEIQNQHRNLLLEEKRSSQVIRHRKKDGAVIVVRSSARSVEWEGRAAVISLMHDITKQVTAENELKQNIVMQAFLAQAAEKLINLLPENKDDFLDDILRQVGEQTKGDRSYIFLLNEQEKTMDNTHEWCAPEIQPQKENLQSLGWDLFPWWLDKLWHFKTIHIPRVADLPDEADVEKQVLQSQGIQSVLVVPIIWQDSLRGFLGLDSVKDERTWKSYEIQALEMLGSSIAVAMERIVSEEQKEELYHQLLQSQKMGSIGRLAGGVAHDFNNMLGVILGYSEMVLEQIDPGDPFYEEMHEIRSATLRSADLTTQLLGFARKQAISPKILQLNDAIPSMIKMLERLIGENIQLMWKPGDGLWTVKMDASQLDQCLANLAVNARDAITGTGRLNIETRNILLDEAFCRTRVECIPGEYVLLTVSDSGCGLDKKELEQIFEPFYTTKKTGEGTGLGLATVYGIVKQNEGFIEVSSRKGTGTSFKLYFPRYKEDKKEHDTEVAETIQLDKTQDGVILIAEDEPSIRKLIEGMVKRLGYTVLTAENAEEALNAAVEHAGKISLLITDVVMPDMNGKMLAESVMNIDPYIKVLYMSGYTADVIEKQGVLEAGMNYIQKPFTRNMLAIKIQRILSDKKPS